jgi:hypothetical protein
MSFLNYDAWLILGMVVLGTTVWMLFKPEPVKVKKDTNPRRR